MRRLIPQMSATVVSVFPQKFIERTRGVSALKERFLPTIPPTTYETETKHGS